MKERAMRWLRELLDENEIFIQHSLEYFKYMKVFMNISIDNEDEIEIYQKDILVNIATLVKAESVPLEKEFQFFVILSSLRSWGEIIPDAIYTEFLNITKAQRDEYSKEYLSQLAIDTDKVFICIHPKTTRFCFYSCYRRIFRACMQNWITNDLQRVNDGIIRMYEHNIALAKNSTRKIQIADYLELLYHISIKHESLSTNGYRDFCNVIEGIVSDFSKLSRQHMEIAQESLKELKMGIESDDEILKIFQCSDFDYITVIENLICKTQKILSLTTSDKANIIGEIPLMIILLKGRVTSHKLLWQHMGRSHYEEFNIANTDCTRLVPNFSEWQRKDAIDCLRGRISQYAPHKLKALLESHTGHVVLESEDNLEDDIFFELSSIRDSCLLLTHSIGRNIPNLEDRHHRNPPNKLPRILLVSADMPHNKTLLTHARNESHDLRKLFESKEVSFSRFDDMLVGKNANFCNVQEKIMSGEYDLIHICCHFEGGALSLSDMDLSCKDLGSFLSVSKKAPIVFINACNSVAEKDYVRPILLGGARAFIGCLWEIPDIRARAVSVQFYKTLFQSKTIGETLKEVRCRLKDDNPNSHTWASYLLYGDPSLQLERSC